MVMVRLMTIFFFLIQSEITSPNMLENFILEPKYAKFMKKCFNYEFNLFELF